MADANRAVVEDGPIDFADLVPPYPTHLPVVRIELSQEDADRLKALLGDLASALSRIADVMEKRTASWPRPTRPSQKGEPS